MKLLIKSNRGRLVLLFIIFTLSSIIGWILLKPDSKELLRVCPEYWAFDQMPGIVSSDGERQYFFVNRERIQYKDMDVDWVKANCSVNKPEISH